MGDWVIAEALRCGVQWVREGLVLPISLNVAARQLRHPDFLRKLSASLAAYPEFPAALLQLELAEPTTAQDTEAISAVLTHCRSLGIRLASYFAERDR